METKILASARFAILALSIKSIKTSVFSNGNDHRKMFFQPLPASPSIVANWRDMLLELCISSEDSLMQFVNAATKSNQINGNYIRQVGPGIIYVIVNVSWGTRQQQSMSNQKSHQMSKQMPFVKIMPTLAKYLLLSIFFSIAQFNDNLIEVVARLMMKRHR